MVSIEEKQKNDLTELIDEELEATKEFADELSMSEEQRNYLFRRIQYQAFLVGLYGQHPGNELHFSTEVHEQIDPVLDLYWERFLEFYKKQYR